MNYHHHICPHGKLCLVQILGRDPVGQRGQTPSLVPRGDPIAVLEPDATTAPRHPIAAPGAVCDLMCYVRIPDGQAGPH